MTFRSDPVHKVKGGYRWGTHGHIYPSPEGAQKQAQAIYASGWREDAYVRKAVRALRPTRGAESRYVLDLAAIMGAVHRGIMMVVEREHLGDIHQDAELALRPPLVRQATEYSCGAAAVLSVLRLYAPETWGEKAERELYDPLGTTPEDGTEPQPMADFLTRELGRAEVRAPSSIRELEHAIDRGEPVIVDVQAWREGKTSWEDDWDDGHYLVLAGYDAKTFLFMDPATAGAYGFIPRAELSSRWHDVLRDGTRVRRLAIFVTPTTRQDAKPPPIGLTDRLLHKIIKYQTPHVQNAFNRMAGSVRANGAQQMFLMGISPRSIAGLDSVIEHARAENVKLITKASAEMLERIREILTSTEGQTTTEITKQLAPLDGIGKRRGMLIARTETSKLNSQLVQHRARAAGLSKYRWSGALDERERPSHRALEGQVFSWDDPPDPEDDGNTGHPGEFPNCRCVPLPYIEELEEPVGEGKEPEEPEAEPDEAAAAEAAALEGEGEEEVAPEGEDIPEEDLPDEEEIAAEGEELPDEEAVTAAIDWPEIEELQRRASELAEAGELDLGTWEELREQALEAAGGDEEAVASLDLLRPDAADVELDLPPTNHQVGMVVPAGGSSCSKCRFLSPPSDCHQGGWVQQPVALGGGGGEPALPAPPDEYCCDFFEPSTRTDAYNPDQPRDERGRFGEGGGGSPSTRDHNVKTFESRGISPDGGGYANLGGKMVAERLDRLMPGAKLEDIESAFGGARADAKIEKIFAADDVSWKDQIELQGRLYAKDGGFPIGTFVRTFGRDRDGKVTASHDELTLNTAVQGRGIGTEILRSTLGFEKEHGVDRAVLSAGPPVGKYVWAEYGFNWGRDTAFDMKASFESYMRESGVDRGVARSIAQRHGDKAWELAAVEVDGKPLGKQFLLGTGSAAAGSGRAKMWHGELPLHDGDPGYEHAKARLKL